MTISPRSASAIAANASVGISADNGCRSSVYQCNMGSTLVVYYSDGSTKSTPVACSLTDIVELYCKSDGNWHDSHNANKPVNGVYCSQ
jgi:hypothetical protein